MCVCVCVCVCVKMNGKMDKPNTDNGFKLIFRLYFIKVFFKILGGSVVLSNKKKQIKKRKGLKNGEKEKEKKKRKENMRVEGAWWQQGLLTTTFWNIWAVD